MFATTYAPGTCGELMQGTLEGQDFLITSPIDLYAQAQVHLYQGNEIHIRSKGTFDKVKQGVRSTLKWAGCENLGVAVEIQSRLPRGKGLASSSSELSAAIAATACAAQQNIGPTAIGSLATTIEPSDAVYAPGIVKCNPVTGDIYEYFPPPPPLAFLIVDTGGSIDSATFDRIEARHIWEQFQPQLQQAQQHIREGLNKHSAAQIAKGALLSARIHQNIRYKPLLEPLWQATAPLGALGINCAHTGTVLGVMFDPYQTEARRLIDRVQTLVSPNAILGVHQLISGGIQYGCSHHKFSLESLQ